MISRFSGSLFHDVAYKVHPTTVASMKQRLPSGQLLVEVKAIDEESSSIDDDEVISLPPPLSLNPEHNRTIPHRRKPNELLYLMI